jgi:hypothetical protein
MSLHNVDNKLRLQLTKLLCESIKEEVEVNASELLWHLMLELGCFFDVSIIDREFEGLKLRSTAFLNVSHA